MCGISPAFLRRRRTSSVPTERKRRGNALRIIEGPPKKTFLEVFIKNASFCPIGFLHPSVAAAQRPPRRFLCRHNKPAPPALSLRRRTAPRTGLRPRAGWLRLRAGCAHASRGLKARAPHGRRGAARRGVACGRVRPCGGSGRRLLLKTDRSMAACCTANGRHTGSMAAGPSGYRPRQICPPGKTDSARCWDKPECSGMLYCK